MLEQFNKLKEENEDVRLDALTGIIGDCKNAGGAVAEGNKSFDYALTRFVRGLQSQVPATRLEFYTGLVALLKLATRVDTSYVLDTIGKILNGSGGDTKSEKKLRRVASILANGAVIRARFCTDQFDTVAAAKILRHIVTALEKKQAFVSLASPFLLHLINVHPAGRIDEEIFSCVESFVVKSESGHYDTIQVKLILSAERRGLEPPLGEISNTEELVSALKAAELPDKQFINLVFEFIHKKGWDEEFWTTFISKVGPFDFQLFSECICESVKSGCPLKLLLTEEIVQLALSVFHNKDLGKEAKDKTVEAFDLMLKWKEDECGLTSKERKKALKILYKKTPNLLFEYQVLVGVIKNHLYHLTGKELEHLAGFFLNSIASGEGEKSTRGQLSSLALLNHIVQQKNSPNELNVDIAKLFFQVGFCKLPNTATEAGSEEEDPISDNVRQQAISYFSSALQKSVHLDFIRSVHDFVKSVVDQTEGGPQLRSSVTEDLLRLWKRGVKILKKSGEDIVALITMVGSIQVIINGQQASSLFEEWLDLVKKIKGKDGSESVILFIVEQVLGMDRPFFNHEAIFRRFVMEGKVTEEAVQSLADAIEPGDDFDDDASDEEDDDDESDVEMTNGHPELFTNPNPARVNGSVAANGNDSESDATVDMDEATEEDLKKMDEALAGVFAAKKRAKDESRLESVRYMRVLNLVDILIGRYKEPPISVVLILLMPLISSVKHNLTVKSKVDTLNRTLATLKRLNKFKKFSGMDEVESDVLSTMADEIRVLIKKKSVPKAVKAVLSSSMNNLLGTCSKSAENVPQKESGKKKKSKKSVGKLSNPPSKPLSSVVTSTIGEPTTKSTKKKDKTNENSTSEGPKDDVAKQGKKTLESSEKGSLPKKRKAQGALEKKKAKLLRMQVLSEGLPGNVE